MFPLLALYAALAASAPTSVRHPLPPLSTAGFMDAYIRSSTGGKATCISGKIPVTATAENLKLTFDVPHNQSGVEKAFLDFFTPGSTYLQETLGENQTVNGTWNIGADLCFPANAANTSDVKGVHVTTHGGGYDRRYWDIAPGLSSVIHMVG